MREYTIVVDLFNTDYAVIGVFPNSRYYQYTGLKRIVPGLENEGEFYLYTTNYDRESQTWSGNELYVHLSKGSVIMKNGLATKYWLYDCEKY